MMANNCLTVTTALALMLVGGGLYEYLVVDPFWPKRPDLIQRRRGGISRGRFWLPVHTLFELALVVSLISVWNRPGIRSLLFVAVASHAASRIWSAFDFIPKELAFEKGQAVDEGSARRWVRRSYFRFPLELLSAAFLFLALRAALHG